MVPSLSETHGGRVEAFTQGSSRDVPQVRVSPATPRREVKGMGVGKSKGKGKEKARGLDADVEMEMEMEGPDGALGKLSDGMNDSRMPLIDLFSFLFPYPCIRPLCSPSTASFFEIAFGLDLIV